MLRKCADLIEASEPVMASARDFPAWDRNGQGLVRFATGGNRENAPIGSRHKPLWSGPEYS